MTRIFSFIILFFIGQSSIAQKVDVNKVYSRMIRNADSLYYAGNCLGARDSFSVASQLIKKEVYAKGRAEEITRCMSLPDSLSTCICSSKRYWLNTGDPKIKEYIILIYKADSAASKKDLKNAQLYLNEATKLDVAKYIADKSKKIEIDTKYNEFIKKGDRKVEQEDYDAAKLAYTEAAKLKPTEIYPRDQIKKCDIEISNLNKFALLKMQGEELYLKKDYKGALEKYQQAAKLYPQDAPVKKKIDELTKLVNK